MASIGVIGSGTWGTALSVLLNGNGHTVQIWSAIPQEIAELKETRIHRNLPEVRLPEAIGLTDDLQEAMRDKDLLVLAVPSVFVRQTSQRMKPYIKKGQVITNVAKGIEEKSLMTLSQIIEEELPEAEVTVLSGPSHAEEVSRGLPTTCVAGARKRSVAEFVQGIFMSEVFRVYTSPDVLGIELGGALKNVIALAAGMADGLGYGDNTKAALITRGIAEISRLGIDMGGRMETFAGLTGIRGFDCDLRQHAQPQPQGGHSDWPGAIPWRKPWQRLRWWWRVCIPPRRLWRCRSSTRCPCRLWNRSMPSCSEACRQRKRFWS